MWSRRLVCGVALTGLFAGHFPAAVAQDDVVRIGLILPLTGPFAASIGLPIEASVRLYLAQHGSVVGDRRIELVWADDGGDAGRAAELATDLVGRQRVHILGGFGLSAIARQVAPIAAAAQVPMVVMAAISSTLVGLSELIVRSSATAPQLVVGLAEWAPTHGLRRIVTLVSDDEAGIEAEIWFASRFVASGGTVLVALRTAPGNLDFAAVLQRVLELDPDAVFVSMPAVQGQQWLRQFDERGLDDFGIRVIGTGDLVDDVSLAALADIGAGVVTAHYYSADHQSALNQQYVAAFRAQSGFLPNYAAVGGYDGMHLIYRALLATEGDVSGAALVRAMWGMRWESPRGPVSIDPLTHEIVQNIYLREVRRKEDGRLWNVEFLTLRDVRDPAKEPSAVGTLQESAPGLLRAAADLPPR